jgi:hypothetical protein
VSIDHVTADKVGNSFLTLDGAAMQRLAITNSILPEGQYGIKGSGTVEGGASWLAFTSPDSTFSGNVIHMTTSCAERQVSRRECEARRGVSAIGSDFKPAALNLPAGADIDAIKAELPVGAF